MNRPAPLVPPEVDLRGYRGFMLDVDRLLASELMALCTAEEFRAAVLLWCRSWKQIPASSLPNDERILASFSGVPKLWKSVRTMAMRGFILCSDDRLYHPVLAEEALKGWTKRTEYRNDQERLKKWRQDQRSARLETVNETPNETRFNGCSETPHETPEKTAMKRLRNADRQGQGQGQGQGQKKERKADSGGGGVEGDFSLEPQPPPAGKPARRPPATKARTQIPAAWMPSDDDDTFAYERLGYPDTIGDIVEAFSNYHEAKGTLMADWSAAWRTWINNEVRYAAERPTRKGS